MFGPDFLTCEYERINQQREQDWHIQAPNIYNDLEILSQYGKLQFANGKQVTTQQAKEWQDNVDYLLQVENLYQEEEEEGDEGDKGNEGDEGDEGDEEGDHDTTGRLEVVEASGVKRLNRVRQRKKIQQWKRRDEVRMKVTPMPMVEEKEKPVIDIPYPSALYPLKTRSFQDENFSKPVEVERTFHTQLPSTRTLVPSKLETQVLNVPDVQRMLAKFLGSTELLTLHQTATSLHRKVLNIKSNKNYLMDKLDLDKVFMAHPTIAERSMTVGEAVNLFCGRMPFREKWQERFLNPSLHDLWPRFEREEDDSPFDNAPRSAHAPADATDEKAKDDKTKKVLTLHRVVYMLLDGEEFEPMTKDERVVYNLNQPPLRPLWIDIRSATYAQGSTAPGGSAPVQSSQIENFYLLYAHARRGGFGEFWKDMRGVTEMIRRGVHIYATHQDLQQGHLSVTKRTLRRVHEDTRSRLTHTNNYSHLIQLLAVGYLAVDDMYLLNNPRFHIPFSHLPFSFLSSPVWLHIIQQDVEAQHELARQNRIGQGEEKGIPTRAKLSTPTPDVDDSNLNRTGLEPSHPTLSLDEDSVPERPKQVKLDPPPIVPEESDEKLRVVPTRLLLNLLIKRGTVYFGIASDIRALCLTREGDVHSRFTFRKAVEILNDMIEHGSHHIVDSLFRLPLPREHLTHYIRQLIGPRNTAPDGWWTLDPRDIDTALRIVRPALLGHELLDPQVVDLLREMGIRDLTVLSTDHGERVFFHGEWAPQEFNAIWAEAKEENLFQHMSNLHDLPRHNDWEYFVWFMRRLVEAVRLSVREDKLFLAKRSVKETNTVLIKWKTQSETELCTHRLRKYLYLIQFLGIRPEGGLEFILLTLFDPVRMGLAMNLELDIMAQCLFLQRTLKPEYKIEYKEWKDAVHPVLNTALRSTILKFSTTFVSLCFDRDMAQRALTHMYMDKWASADKRRDPKILTLSVLAGFEGPSFINLVMAAAYLIPWLPSVGHYIRVHNAANAGYDFNLDFLQALTLHPESHRGPSHSESKEPDSERPPSKHFTSWTPMVLTRLTAVIREAHDSISEEKTPIKDAQIYAWFGLVSMKIPTSSSAMQKYRDWLVSFQAKTWAMILRQFPIPRKFDSLFGPRYNKAYGCLNRIHNFRIDLDQVKFDALGIVTLWDYFWDNRPWLKRLCNNPTGEQYIEGEHQTILDQYKDMIALLAEQYEIHGTFDSTRGSKSKAAKSPGSRVKAIVRLWDLIKERNPLSHREVTMWNSSSFQRGLEVAYEEEIPLVIGIEISLYGLDNDRLVEDYREVYGKRLVTSERDRMKFQRMILESNSQVRAEDAARENEITAAHRRNHRERERGEKRLTGEDQGSGESDNSDEDDDDENGPADEPEGADEPDESEPTDEPEEPSED